MCSSDLQYPEYGEHITGNENGDIYKITWKVRDGMLLASDNYYLEYKVKIDTDEPGFQFNYLFPTSSNITAYYKGTKNEDYSEVLESPLVSLKQN